MAKQKTKTKTVPSVRKVLVDERWIADWEVFYELPVDTRADDMTTRLAVVAAMLAEDHRRLTDHLIEVMAATETANTPRGRVAVSIHLPDGKPQRR